MDTHLADDDPVKLPNRIISSPTLLPQANNPFQNYLFAPPHYQPRFHTTNVNTLQFPKTNAQSNSNTLHTQSPDSLFLFFEKECDDLNQAPKRCWDYNDYTNLRIEFTLKTMLTIAVVLIIGFAHFSKIYPAFYLAIPIILMATGTTFGQSLPTMYAVFIGLFLALAWNVVIFAIFHVTPLVVGLALPIGFVATLVALGFTPNPVIFKLFSIFFPIFLLMSWLHNSGVTGLLILFDLCGLCFGLTIFFTLFWPLQTNHHVDYLVGRLLKNSARIQYLITRGFLNERYNRTHLLDYSHQADYFALHTATSGPKVRPPKVQEKLIKKQKETLRGTLFEAHLDGLTRHNRKHHSRKVRNQANADYIAVTSPQVSGMNGDELMTSISPVSNDWKKLNYRRFSHKLAYDLHCQGGSALYQESYSDDNTSSTDDDTCLYVFSSESSATATDDSDHESTHETSAMTVSSAVFMPKQSKKQRNKALHGNTACTASSIPENPSQLYSPSTPQSSGTASVPTTHTHDDIEDSMYEYHSAGTPPPHENAYFRDLYSALNRCSAPNHPQGSLKKSIIGRFSTTSLPKHPDDSIGHENEALLGGEKCASAVQGNTSAQPNYHKENEHFLHVPFPQLYFSNLSDILTAMESDLDLLRTHSAPLQYEGIFFRILFLVFSVFTCCLCGKYSYSDLRRPKVTTTFHQQHPTGASKDDVTINTAHSTNSSPFSFFSRHNIFYPQPCALYPNIFSATSYFSIPYSPESLNTFIVEFLLLITNVRGMMQSLQDLPGLSRGGLMLYHFLATLLRHDMKRASMMYKGYIVNILNHNKDIAAFDSAFIHACFNMSSQNYFTSLHPTRNAAKVGPTTPVNNIANSNSNPTHPTIPQPSLNEPVSSAIMHHRDLFSALYISLTKHKRINPTDGPFNPSEKDVRKMSFVPGSYSCVLHSLRNLWLQYSRVRQFAFYGIRKTRLITTTTTIARPRNPNLAPHQHPKPKIKQQSTVYTRKITDPIFNFYTSIAQQHAKSDETHSPAYNYINSKYEDITTSVLHSAFTYLHATPHQQAALGASKQPLSTTSRPSLKPFSIAGAPVFDAISEHTPTTPTEDADSTQPHSTPPLKSANSRPAKSHHKQSTKEPLKKHHTVTLDDITVFNNFFFNYDRFYTRLLHMIIPSVTSHLYPITGVSTTIPTSLAIPHNDNFIFDSLEQKHTLSNDHTPANSRPNSRPPSPSNQPSTFIPTPQASSFESNLIGNTATNPAKLANAMSDVQHSTPQSPIADPASTTSHFSQPLGLPTSTNPPNGPETEDKNKENEANRQNSLLRAAILVPGPIPTYYSLPPPCTTQDLIDCFVPLLFIKIWTIITKIILPMKVPKPQSREVSVIYTERPEVEEPVNLESKSTAFSSSSTSFSPKGDLTLDIPAINKSATDITPKHVIATDFVYQTNAQTGQLESIPIRGGFGLNDSDDDDDDDDDIVEESKIDDYDHRFKTQAPPTYVQLSLQERLSLTWKTLIKPNPGEKMFYKFFWRCIVCVTLASLPAIIPSPIQIKAYNHWPTLSAAILLGGNSGASFQLIFNRIIANILGAFYAYFMVLIAIKIDEYNDNDGNLTTGIGAAAFIVVMVTIYAGYFSYLRLSRSKSTDYAVTTIVSVCVVGLGSINASSQTSETVLLRLQYTILGAIFVLVCSYIIYPFRGDWGVYRLLSGTARQLLTLIDFNSLLLAHASLYNYSHESFDSNFGPTVFPLVSLDKDKKSTITYPMSEFDHKQFKELQRHAAADSTTGSAVYNNLFEKIILLDYRDHIIFYNANYPHQPFGSHQGALKTIDTSLRIFHPCDSRSRFYHMALSIFTGGKMDPALIGLTQIPYPPKAALLEKCQNNYALARRQLNTIRHTNYLKFLHIYNIQMKNRAGEVRANILTLTRQINALESETVLSMISPIKTNHIVVLRQTNQHLYDIVRSVHRVHEILFSYLYMLVSLNEYYNISGVSMAESFKSVIQSHYDQHLQQLHRKKPHTPKNQNHIPKHQNQNQDDNDDITRLLVAHSYHLLNNSVTPKAVTSDEQLLHLKLKSHQVSNMLLNESLPLFLNFNQTISLLFQSILGTLDTLINRTTIETFFSFAISIKFSYPLFHSHNTHTFTMFRLQQAAQRNELRQSESENRNSTPVLQQTSTDTCSPLPSATDQQRDPLASPQHRQPQTLALAEEESEQDEVDFFNTPYAFGCLFSFIGLKIGPCCIRKTHQAKLPVKSSQLTPARPTPVSPQSPGQSAKSIEMTVMYNFNPLSPQAQPQATLPQPVTPPKPKTTFVNPYYERSKRHSQQKQYLYQIISYVRQIRTISKELTYQRFYGGRDGYYTTYPTPLILIEHSFLTTIKLLPHSFVDIVANLNSLGDEM